MSLRQESIQLLADTIAEDVFAVLCKDGRYRDGIMNSLPEAIAEVVGKVSPEVTGQLGAKIMDKIGIPQDNDPYADNNIWRTRYETLFRYVKNNYAESYVDGAEYAILNREGVIKTNACISPKSSYQLTSEVDLILYCLGIHRTNN